MSLSTTSLHLLDLSRGGDKDIDCCLLHYLHAISQVVLNGLEEYKEHWKHWSGRVQSLCSWEEPKKAWHHSFLGHINIDFTLAECLGLLIHVRLLLKCSFWDASALASCLFSFAAWFKWVVLFFHLPGSLDADGGLGLRVARSCARASGLSLWLWKRGCAAVRKFRRLLNSGAKTNYFLMLMTNPSCLQLLSSPSSPCTIRPTSFVVSSVFVF